MKFKKIISALAAITVMFTAVSSAAGAAGTRVSVHDPSVIKDPASGTYYVFGSHIDAAKTNDLQNWKRFTNGYAKTNNVEFGDLSKNLKKAFDWAGEDLGDCVGGFAVWAPDVIWNPDYVNSDGSKGAYLMYFCTSSTWNTSVIAYASSQKIEGPYTFVDTLIYSGFTSNDSWAKSTTKNVNRKYTSTNIDELIASGEVTFNSSWFADSAYNYREFPNAIDPTIYYGTDGKMYMTYGSWSGGIFTLEIDKKTGKCIHPKTGKTSDGRMVDSYFGTKLIGGYHKSGEGPFIEYNADTGYYYLWVTYGGLLSDGGYNMRVFRSKSPTGPFTDAKGQTAIHSANSNLDATGLKVMGNYKFSTNNTAYMACGHNSVLKDDDGKWYIFYHARFNDNSEYHEVRVHSMQFNADGWPVVAPNEYSGDEIHEGGYETADIAGTYEFINHGNDTGSKIYSSSNITLTSDGKITGAVTGTWTESSGSADAVITIGGQKYSGKFLAAKDEKGKLVMSFTAVGSNNQTIWGNKTTAFTGKPRGGFAAEKFTEGSAYRIKNVNSGLYLNAEGGRSESGTNVYQSDADGDIWRIFDAGDGYCYLAPAADESASVVLDVAGKKADNGTNIGLYNYKGDDNQKFLISKNTDGSYKIRTKISAAASCVEVINGETTSGSNVQEWEVNNANCQDWLLEPADNPGIKMSEDLIYTFVNKNSDMVMDIENGKMDAGTNVRQWESNGEKCQQWTLKEFAQGGNYYYIHSYSDDSYVLRTDGSNNGGNLSISANATNDSSMLFKFAKNLDGTYSVMTRSSKDSKILEVINADKEMGGNIQQWEPNGNDCQRWALKTEDKPAPPEEPSVSPTDITPGDLNGDGVINIIDLVLLKNTFIDPVYDRQLLLAADVNSDDTVNTADIIALVSKLTGK